MLLTHVIWQTDLKPLSVTNAKNGAIPLSLTPTIHTIHARGDKASEWVGGSFPVRNSLASYGASAVTRTPDRGQVAEVKNQRIGVAGSQSGFPKKPFSPLMSNRCSVSSIKMLKTVHQGCVMRMR